MEGEKEGWWDGAGEGGIEGRKGEMEGGKGGMKGRKGGIEVG